MHFPSSSPNMSPVGDEDRSLNSSLNSLNGSLTSLRWLADLESNSSGLGKGLVSPRNSYEQRQNLERIDEAPEEFLLLEEETCVDWKTDGSVKPPFSYAWLIFAAIKSSPERKLTLSEIYDYIQTEYCFYRITDSGWKNSIRHNLSQNKCFAKVSRGCDGRGKGGFWTIDQRYEAIFADSVEKKRRKKAKRRAAEIKRQAKQQELEQQQQQQQQQPLGAQPMHTQIQPDIELPGFDWQEALLRSINYEYLLPQLHSGESSNDDASCDMNRTPDRQLPQDGITPMDANSHPWDLNSSFERHSLNMKQKKGILRLLSSGRAGRLFSPNGSMNRSFGASLMGLNNSFNMSMNNCLQFPNGLTGSIAAMVPGADVSMHSAEAVAALEANAFMLRAARNGSSSCDMDTSDDIDMTAPIPSDWS